MPKFFQTKCVIGIMIQIENSINVKWKLDLSIKNLFLKKWIGVSYFGLAWQRQQIPMAKLAFPASHRMLSCNHHH